MILTENDFFGSTDAYHYANTHMAMDQPLNETEQADGEEHEEEDSGRTRRRKRDTCPNGSPVGARTLELLVVVDSSLNEYHRAVRDVQDYTLTLMNTVRIFHLVSVCVFISMQLYTQCILWVDTALCYFFSKKLDSLFPCESQVLFCLCLLRWPVATSMNLLAIH